MKKCQDVDLPVCKIFLSQLCCRHICCISGAEQRTCSLLCLLGFFFAMNQFCQFISKDFFGLIQLGAFPFVHLINLLQRKERKHTQAF